MAAVAIAAVASYAGSAIGTYVGSTIVGAIATAAIGAALSSQFGSKQKGAGPRLNDLMVMGTDYGQAIPYCVGSVRTAGQIIWASQRYETATTTEQGKGGGGSEFTSFTYDVDLLIMLTENEIIGVSRIWSNGELVYDGTTKEGVWARMTVYTGAEDQLPDIVYIAAMGTENAPAYRGRGTVFIQGLQLGSSGQIPNLTFELGIPGADTYCTWVWDGGHAGAGWSISDAELTATNDLLADSAVFGDTLLTDQCYWEVLAGGEAGTTMGLGIAPADQDTTPGDWSSDKIGIWVSGQWRIAGNSYEAPTWNPGDVLRMQVNKTTGTVKCAVNDLPFEIVWEYDDAIADEDMLVVMTRTNNDTAQVSATILHELQYHPEVGYSGLASGVPYLGEGSNPCTPLATVVSDLCERAGLEAAAYDVTGLEGIGSPADAAEVCAFYISDVSPTRNALDVLMSAYAFEATKSSKVYFRFRQSTAVADIPFGDLSAGDVGNSQQAVDLTLNNELEVPSQMAVSYRNLQSDFQIATEYSDRLLSGQESTNVVQLPLGLAPAQARKIADVMLYDQIAGLMRGKLSLPMQYIALEPNDIVNATDHDGEVYRLRLITRRDSGTYFGFDAVVDEAAVALMISADADASLVADDYPTQTEILTYALSQWEMLDIPLLRDVDDAPGWYAAAKKVDDATGIWPGATLLSSNDEVNYVTEATFADACVFGTCTTTLGSWTGATFFDEANSVTVNVGEGELASSTRAAMLADTTINVMLIGSEVIRFRLATLESAGVYKLTGLLRGQRGTQWAMTGHASSERAVLINTSLRRGAIAATEIGVEQSWKTVTTGKTVSSTDWAAETNTGVCLKPFAPFALRSARDSAGALVFTWERRTRLLSENFLLGAVPLGEESEAYDVELLDEDENVLVSDTVTSREWNPSGSPGAVGLTLATCARNIMYVGGELYGIPEETLDGTGTRSVVRFDQASGVVLAQSEALGTRIQHVAVAGSQLAAICYSYSGAGALNSGQVKRVNLNTLAVEATYDAPTPTDPAGIAYDGSVLWITERTSGKVRSLNATTLVSIADYALDTGMEACTYAGGYLWILARSSNEVIKWDVATQTETLRFTCVNFAFDVLVVGSLVFVQGASQVGVYNLSGIPQAYHTSSAGGLPGWCMAPYGSDVAVLNQGSGGLTSSIKVLSATTALLLSTQASPYYRTLSISADTASNLWIAGVPSSASSTLASANLAGGAAVDVDGALLRVYQLSATVGRGYVAELALE